MTQPLLPLKIAYLFQGIGTNYSEPLAVQLHIYHQIRSLQQAGHWAALLALQGQQVIFTQDLRVFTGRSLPAGSFGKLGLSGNKAFKRLESGVRRLQSKLRTPYLALFDSYRIYDGCCQNLQSYDLIHERYNLLALGGALASKRLKIPYVLEVNADLLEERRAQGAAEHGVRGLFAVRSTRYCFNTAQRIISVSSQLKEHLVRTWKVDPAKITVLPNAANIEAFSRTYDAGPIRRQLSLTHEPVVMFVGGFYIWHDLPLLVRSFSKVIEKVPNARLVLVGDGRTRAEVGQLIVDMGLERAVIMAGVVAHQQVPALLAAADVAAAPNTLFFDGHGGSPLKIFEYMAAGKAIVASRVGQVADLIQDDNNGMLIEPGDTDGFANAIVSLLIDPLKRGRLGRQARQSASKQHTWEQYAGRLESIYSGVLEDFRGL
ncbi:MAG: glycosyltransferase family 4 protein [Candidatus Promineifilaceae bacterium]